MLHLTEELLTQIHVHGEQAYPDEGAGFLLGAYSDNGTRTVKAIFPLANSREDEARHNRYLITPEDYLKAELAADRLGLSLIGVFHSHPDHPNRPSEFDRELYLKTLRMKKGTVSFPLMIVPPPRQPCSVQR